MQMISFIARIKMDCSPFEPFAGHFFRAFFRFRFSGDIPTLIIGCVFTARLVQLRRRFEREN